MSTIRSLVDSLQAEADRHSIGGTELAKRSGLSRASVTRAMGGDENFSLNTLLAMSEVLGLEVLLVPKALADGLRSPAHTAAPLPSVISKLKDL